MYKTYTKYIKIYESTTPQPHIISLSAVPGQYVAGLAGIWAQCGRVLGGAFLGCVHGSGGFEGFMGHLGDSKWSSW